MGEEVAEYQGAYKISQGLLDEFGADASSTRRSPSTALPAWASGRVRRPEADRRVHDVQLRHAGDRPDHQLGRQDALYGGRPDGVPDRLPRPERCGGARCGPAQPDYAAWYSQIPGLKVIQPYSAATQGLMKSAIRDPKRSSSSRTRSSTVTRSRCPDRRLDRPIGKARVHRKGKDVTIVSFGIGMTYRRRGGRATGQGGHRRRGHRPSHDPSDGLDAIVRSVKKTNAASCVRSRKAGRRVRSARTSLRN